MLDELLDEKKKGRLDGPFTAPRQWGVECCAVQGHELQPLPSDCAFAALCFAVEQGEKVRRCDDYRRSFHNSTIQTSDVPHGHDLDTYISVMKRYHELQVVNPVIWGQDLDAAYRQIPVRPDADAFTILQTEDGPTLWRHAAAPFGATASVWAFNRLADALVSLARRLLLIPVCHFVDDFMCIDPVDLAASSCLAFKTLFGQLGLRMKPTKEQLPSPTQKMLGVYVHVQNQQVLLSACPNRKFKAVATLEQALASNKMSSSLAQQTAGKLAFLATTFFGNVGKAALQPLYARGRGLGEASHDHLTTGLRRAIVFLLYVLRHAQPRCVPLVPKQFFESAIVYTDAFYQPGTKHGGCSKQALNGWGYVVTIGSETVYDFGEVPQHFVQRFASRRAFIYMLEIFAVLVCVTACHDRLPPFIRFYIDNQAGKYALVKGYGKCAAINTLITAFWTLVEVNRWCPHFSYVKSGLNISDPVSRADDSIARSFGWTRLHTNVEPLLNILANALDNIPWTVFGSAIKCFPNFQGISVKVGEVPARIGVQHLCWHLKLIRSNPTNQTLLKDKKSDCTVKPAAVNDMSVRIQIR